MDNDKMIAKKQTDVNAQYKNETPARVCGCKILSKIGVIFSDPYKKAYKGYPDLCCVACSCIFSFSGFPVFLPIFITGKDVLMIKNTGPE